MQFPSHGIRPPRSQAYNSVGYVRIFAGAASNPGPPDYSFDGINDLPFPTLLSAQIALW